MNEVLIYILCITGFCNTHNPLTGVKICYHARKVNLQHVFLLLIVLANGSFEKLLPSVKIDHQRCLWSRSSSGVFINWHLWTLKTWQWFYQSTQQYSTAVMTRRQTVRHTASNIKHICFHKKKRNDGRDPVSNGESDADLQSLKMFRKIQLITDSSSELSDNTRRILIGCVFDVVRVRGLMLSGASCVSRENNNYDSRFLCSCESEIDSHLYCHF